MQEGEGYWDVAARLLGYGPQDWTARGLSSRRHFVNNNPNTDISRIQTLSELLKESNCAHDQNHQLRCHATVPIIEVGSHQVSLKPEIAKVLQDRIAHLGNIGHVR